MTRYAAFLRAINVGGHTVKMQDLRQIFEAIGFGRVETFIQSGNVIFETSEQAGAIEHAIEERLLEALGYPVITFVRTLDELALLTEVMPFQDPQLDTSNQLYVAFLKEPPGEKAQQALLALNNRVDEFAVNGREVYWLRRRQNGESEYTGMQIEKVLKNPATVRNITTLRKMINKYS